MNVSKVILIVIVVLILVLIFFALTGIDLRKPEQAALKLLDQLAQLNRSINRALRNFFYNLRVSFQERFSR
jgi:cell shape-determining protein MreC